MTMNLDPEALRMLTDFIASAGAAIGGKGSVGDLVGQQVHNINQEQAAEQTRIRAEERESKKKAKAAQQMIRLLSGGQPAATPSDGKSYGVLKDDAGGEGTFAAQQPVTSLLSMLTPDGKPGPTSIAKDKKGNTIVKGLFDPTADTSELNTNDILQTIYAQRMLEKAPKEDMLTDLQIENEQWKQPTENEKILRDKMATAGINLKEIVKLDIGNGQEVSLPLEEIVPFIIAEQQTPSSVKEARVLQKGGEEAKFLREILGSRASAYDPYARAQMGEQGRTTAEIGGKDWQVSVDAALKNNDEYQKAESVVLYGKNRTPAEKAAAKSTMDRIKNDYVLGDLGAIYRGKPVQFRKILKDGKTMWAVVDANGNDLEQYYPRFGDAEAEYKALKGAK